jgi:RNA polymerase sigma-70 factor (ECF subfamily)
MSSYPGQLTGWMAPALISEKALAPGKTLDSSETITALVAEYSATLYRVAYSVMRNAAEAEDAVQEAFLRVLKNQEKLAEIRDVRVWLIRITWNVVLDKKRRGKTRPENDDIADYVRVLPASDRRADDSLVSTQQHGRILKLIDRLPHKEREALLLSAVEELSTVQIALVLGTTESSIRSRIFRARRELSELLEKEGIPR